MHLPTFGWSNKHGTSNRTCACESWQQHWMTVTGFAWPATCSAAHCDLRATLGGCLVNTADIGEHIVPLCDVCTQLERSFSLKEEITIVAATPSAACRRL